MKSLKTLLTCGMLLVSTAAFAQFSNAGGSRSTSSRSGGLVKKTDSYSRIYVGYNPMTFAYDIDGKDDLTMHGVSLGFTHGFSLSKLQPLFLELGLKGTFNLKNEQDDNIDDKETKNKFASVSMPVNFGYKLSFGNGDVSLMPFFGITFKGNIMGKSRVELDGKKKKETDWFDKKDMGKKNTFKRFQAGWQIGANLDYKQLAIGLHYGSDFNEIAKKTTTSNWQISLGYNF